MHTNTTVTKIYCKSRDTYMSHITGILCPRFKLFTVQSDRRKMGKAFFLGGKLVKNVICVIDNPESRQLISAPLTCSCRRSVGSIGSQTASQAGRAGSCRSYPSGCVCVRSGGIKARSPSKGRLRQNRGGGFSFHLHTTAGRSCIVQTYIPVHSCH